MVIFLSWYYTIYYPIIQYGNSLFRHAKRFIIKWKKSRRSVLKVWEFEWGVRLELFVLWLFLFTLQFLKKGGKNEKKIQKKVVFEQNNVGKPGQWENGFHLWRSNRPLPRYKAIFWVWYLSKGVSNSRGYMWL